MTSGQGKLELWGGVECTVNRVRDGYIEQLDRSVDDSLRQIPVGPVAKVGHMADHLQVDALAVHRLEPHVETFERLLVARAGSEGGRAMAP